MVPGEVPLSAGLALPDGAHTAQAFDVIGSRPFRDPWHSFICHPQVYLFGLQKILKSYLQNY